MDSTDNIVEQEISSDINNDDPVTHHDWIVGVDRAHTNDDTNNDDHDDDPITNNDPIKNENCINQINSIVENIETTT